MKADNRNRKAIDDTPALLGNIESLQHTVADDVQGQCEGTATSIEAALRGQTREQTSVLLPVAEHGGFHLPATALADERHPEQLAITTGRWYGTGTTKPRSDALTEFINNDLHDQPEIIKVNYHHVSSEVRMVVFRHHFHTTLEDLPSITLN